MCVQVGVGGKRRGLAKRGEKCAGVGRGGRGRGWVGVWGGVVAFIRNANPTLAATDQNRRMFD